MKVKFDSLNRFEVPKFYLCSPGSVNRDGVLSNIVGCLFDTTDEELVLNFNAVSELNFRVLKVARENKDANTYAQRIYNAVQNRRMVFVEGIGYFIITNVNSGYSTRDGDYKDVRAESCEIEIQNKMLTYIEDGTYEFTPLLEKIVSTIPMWTIGSVDPEVAKKSRTFEDVSVELNTLGFLIDNMQDAYECIFAFDTSLRQIHVYDQNNYVELTDIHITKSDVINSLQINEDSNDLYTAISVLGSDDLNISPVNPLGTNVIYNFDYYLNWMSTGLQDKVKAWKDLIKTKSEQYYNLNLDYYKKLTSQSDLQAEAKKIDTQLNMYRKCRENIVAEGNTSDVDEYNKVITENGGTPITISEEVNQTIAEIDTLIAQAEEKLNKVNADLQTLTTEMDSVKAQIVEIQNAVNLKTYFTEGEYSELYNYIFEGSYRDEYIGVTDIMTYEEKFQQMKLLYDRSVQQLNKVSTPTQEFSIDVENFLFVKEFERWSSQLKTGSLINVELDTDDVAQLFLSTITINYQDRNLSLTFGNRFNKFDPKSMFENVLGDIKKSSNTLEYIKDIIYPIKNGELNSMREALATSRTLTKNAVLASKNQEVVIDDTGYTGRELLESGEYDPRQVKLTGRTMVFTDDAWETCKVALGEIILGEGKAVYGLNAEVIIGDLIMGNQLRILDNEGKDLFTVMDGKIAASIGEVNKKVDDSISGVNQTITQKETALKADINGVESRVTESITAEINGVREEMTQKESSLRQDINGMESKVTETVTKEVQKDISAVNGKVDAVNGRVDGVDGKIDNVKQEITEKESAINQSVDEISAKVQVNTENIDGLDKKVTNKFSQIDQTAENINATVSSQSNELGVLKSKVTEVEENAQGVEIRVKTIEDDGAGKVTTTGTGYTFNDEGLRIKKSGHEIENLIDNTGMYVKRNDAVMLEANANGVKATDLTARNYLIIGNNSRLEDYGNSGTALFWIGGES